MPTGATGRGCHCALRARIASGRATPWSSWVRLATLEAKRYGASVALAVWRPALVRLRVDGTVPEIAKVLTSFLEAIGDGDEQAVSNRFSRQPGFERYGSDRPSTGGTATKRCSSWPGDPQDRRLPVASGSATSTRCRKGPSAGRAARWNSRPRATRSYRVSGVLHLEHGDWKVVQWRARCPRRTSRTGPSSPRPWTTTVGTRRPDRTCPAPVGDGITTRSPHRGLHQGTACSATTMDGRASGPTRGDRKVTASSEASGEEPGRRVHAGLPVLTDGPYGARSRCSRRSPSG